MNAGLPSALSALNPIRKQGTLDTGSQFNRVASWVNFNLETGGVCAAEKFTSTIPKMMAVNNRLVIAPFIDRNCRILRSEFICDSNSPYLGSAWACETNFSAVRPIRMSSASRNSWLLVTVFPRTRKTYLPNPACPEVSGWRAM